MRELKLYGEAQRVTAETGYGLASGYPKDLLGDAVIGYAVCLVLDQTAAY